MLDTVSWMGLRASARLTVARRVRLRVEGLQHVPAGGPALIASRHYHHLYDAAVLLSAIGRQTHFLVALDWVRDRRGRRLMEALCGAARWPVVLRTEELARQVRARPGGPAYRQDEAQRYLRRAMQEGVALLRQDRVLVVFPEAYPDVDPDYTPKNSGTPGSVGTVLPFRPGFARLAAWATRGRRDRPVPVLPTGLAYRRREVPAGRGPAGETGGASWDVTLRFGRPVAVTGGDPEAVGRVVREVESAVRDLSRPGAPTAAVRR